MADTRVTYLIGAGASANALPVVNGLKNRLRIFFNYLTSELDKNSGNDFIRNNQHRLLSIENLISEIEKHYTIDTLAKKYFLRHGDNKNYKFLKSLMACYFYFEQIPLKHKKILANSIINWASKSEIIQKYELEKKEFHYSEEYKNLIKEIEEPVDYRYDSFFAALLENIDGKLQLPSNINIVSWNYDNQFELAYKNYINEDNIEIITNKLQVYPSQYNYTQDNNRSQIIKINGTASLINSEILNDIDLPTTYLDDKILSQFRKLQYYFDNNNIPETNIKFAWEKDEHVNLVRNYAHDIVSKSDVIVVIGYSFPTFNREVDRDIFKKFNEDCISTSLSLNKDMTGNVKKKIVKKIYIQDLQKNASKTKERLKAVGNNLFDVAEIYDDVDQFFIPPEL